MTSVFKWSGGALAVLVLLAVLTLGAGYRTFDRTVAEEVRALFGRSVAADAPVVTEAMLQDLPAPVRRYLTYVGVVGKPIVHTVRLKQEGRFRTSPQQPWMPITAKQYYNADSPAFLWDATFHQGGLPIIRAYDSYADGEGYMLGKLGALINILEGQGEGIDQGAMIRYLNEMTLWFPSALLRDNVSFRAIDEETAEIIFTDHGKTATATLTVDEEGRLVDFVANRYRDSDQTYGPWSTPISEYADLAGLRLPAKGVGVWKLPEGDFEYVDLTITEIEYDVAQAY